MLGVLEEGAHKNCVPTEKSGRWQTRCSAHWHECHNIVFQNQKLFNEIIFNYVKFVSYFLNNLLY